MISLNRRKCYIISLEDHGKNHAQLSIIITYKCLPRGFDSGSMPNVDFGKIDAWKGSFLVTWFDEKFAVLGQREDILIGFEANLNMLFTKMMLTSLGDGSGGGRIKLAYLMVDGLTWLQKQVGVLSGLIRVPNILTCLFHMVPNFHYVQTNKF